MTTDTSVTMNLFIDQNTVLRPLAAAFTRPGSMGIQIGDHPLALYLFIGGDTDAALDTVNGLMDALFDLRAALLGQSTLYTERHDGCDNVFPHYHARVEADLAATTDA